MTHRAVTAKNEAQLQPDRLIQRYPQRPFCSAPQAGEDALRRSIRILAKAIDILQANHGVPRQFLLFLLIGLCARYPT